MAVEYCKAHIGRIFVAVVDHGEDLIEELKTLAREEEIKTGLFFLVGALKEASMVRGPKKPEVPPEPSWFRFDDAREILALGTLFSDADNDEPFIHFHSVAGREEYLSMGCVREKAEVYLTVEVTIFELKGVTAGKSFDAATGLKLLRFQAQSF